MTDRILTKKDIAKARLRWFYSLEFPNSFERLQAVSFAYTVSDSLQKIYKDDQEGLKDAMKRHLEFFNTEGTVGSLIVGIVLALEEKKKLEGNVDPEMIANLKLGLMGPVAGIGDSLIQGTVKAIILSLAASFGLQGNILGGLIPFLFPAVVYFFGRYLAILGYNLGTEAVNKLISSGLMNDIIRVVSILGIFMMGALSSSYVKLSTPLKFTVGAGKTIEVQQVLDSILPGLLPLLCIFGIVWYFKNKKQNYFLLIIFIIVCSMLGCLVGLF